MITITSGGGLGNNMFMYGAAYILSKKHKMCIGTKLTEYPINSNLDIIPRQFTSDILVNNDNFMEISKKENIEHNLVLHGYFQTSQIINEYKNDLKSCFEMNLNPIQGTIIHYRLGDLLELYDQQAVVKLNYFEKCINLINNKKNMYIITDSPDYKDILYLTNKYNIKLVDMKRADSIKFGSRFTNKILSMGTFSWWIGFLGNQKSNVYCPIPSEYINWMGDIYVLNDWNYISYK